MGSIAMRNPEDTETAVVLGVDTHLDSHVAVGLGRRLVVASFPATAAGYTALLRWAEGLRYVRTIGVEGTGCYGAGLARFLRAGPSVGTGAVWASPTPSTRSST